VITRKSGVERASPLAEQARAERRVWGAVHDPADRVLVEFDTEVYDWRQLPGVARVPVLTVALVRWVRTARCAAASSGASS
jgi:hypothetical protein